MQVYILMAILFGGITLLFVVFFPIDKDNLDATPQECLKDGQSIINIYAGRYQGTCCETLKEITAHSYTEEWNRTKIPPTDNKICSACGNNICNQRFEHILNCPEDCSK